METKPSAKVVRFGVFELEPGSGELRRNGLKVRLPEQSFQVLRLLLSRPARSSPVMSFATRSGLPILTLTSTAG